MELQLYTSATANFYVKNLENLQFFFIIEKRFTKWSVIELQNTCILSYYKFFNMFSCICMYLQTWDSVSFEMSPKRLCVYIYAYYNLFLTFFKNIAMLKLILHKNIPHFQTDIYIYAQHTCS